MEWGRYYQDSNEWTDLEVHSWFRCVSLCSRTIPGPSSAGRVVDTCIMGCIIGAILARRRDLRIRNWVVATDQSHLHITGRHFVQKSKYKYSYMYNVFFFVSFSTQYVEKETKNCFINIIYKLNLPCISSKHSMWIID